MKLMEDPILTLAHSGVIQKSMIGIIILGFRRDLDCRVVIKGEKIP
jgi:phosphotransferase system HPr-like phosphotransfer protein